MNTSHSVHHPLLSAGEGGLNLILNFQKAGGLDRTLTRIKGGDLFEGEGCNFYIKNKLKSEIFNGKRSLMAKKIFSVS